jgi:hypothetical protein
VDKRRNWVLSPACRNEGIPFGGEWPPRPNHFLFDIEAAMPQTSFDPRAHGFQFANGSFHFHVGPINCTILCGGMSYGSLDYFYNGLNLPESKLAPAEENPLQSYLYDLQITAHRSTIPSFLASWIKPPLVTPEMFNDLETSTGRNEPVVICLFQPFKGHHVLAIGCDKSAKTIDLYDSNHPNMKAGIAYVDGYWKHTLDKHNNKWQGWFIDPGYYQGNWPHRPPLSWRYCRTCHGLFTTSFGLICQCPGGGRHIFNESFEYFLPCFNGDGEQGWTVCEKCQGLYKPGDPDMPPFCGEMGFHVPKKLGTEVMTFGVMKTGLGETNWRRCTNCSTLFWYGHSSYGKCPTGGAHVPDRHSARPYVVDYRTVADR